MSDPAPAVSEIAPHIDRHLNSEGALLPILHDVQQAFGCIPAAAHAPIAEALNISTAEVHGVASFYHDFRKTPRDGRRVLKICRAEACQATGGAANADAILSALGVDWGGTTADGAITVEPVYCLGLCACGPAAMLEDDVIGRATPDRVRRAIGEATT